MLLNGSKARAPALAAIAVAAFFAAAANAGPIPVGGMAFKTNAAVPDTPKYTTTLLPYMTAPNIVGTLVSAITGGLPGTITSTVFINPSTGFLTFQYMIAGIGNPSPIARSTLGGTWAPFAITDAGADASGVSGGSDPTPEWTDGDPLFLGRSPTDSNPVIQWREAGLGSAIATGNFSSRIYFETNATLFNQAPAAFIDTALVGQSNILAPTTLIPLPSAAMMALSTALGIGVRRRPCR